MTAEGHHTRTHFPWAASDSAANWTCAGKIALCAIFPERPEAEYAARGTAVHECNDRALINDLDPGDFLGDVVKTDAHEITITEKEVESSRLYVDFIRSLPGKLLVEQKFELTKLDTPFPSGGTVDAALLDLPARHIHIVDYKNGTGFVDANGNKQLRTYALCYLLTLPDEIANQVDTITSTIVQPNVAGEPIRSEDYHKADLLDWAHDMLAAMRRSKQAEDEFKLVNDNKVLLDEWSDKWLVTGHCRFCDAAGGCPKRRKETLAAMPELARRWHEDVSLTTPPVLSNSARLGSVEELEHDLDGIDALKEWIGARASYAKLLAEQGTKFKSWGLVDSVGNRKYVEKDQAKLASTLIKQFKMTDDQVYAPREVKSPAQIEKTLKAAAKKEFTAAEKTLWVRPVTGKNLVRLDKTERAPAKTTAETFHETVD